LPILNNADRPPVRSRDGSRVLYEGAPLPHFNEVDECAGLDGLMTLRVHKAMGQPVENTLHDLRWGDVDRSGTVPDYVGPADGTPGVLLAGVRAGSPAEVAGLRRGDILVGIDGRDVRDIEDFMYALSASKPGQRGKVAVLRDGKRVELEVTFGAPMRR